MSKDKEYRQNSAALDFSRLMQNAGVVPIKTSNQQTHPAATKKAKPMLAVAIKSQDSNQDYSSSNAKFTTLSNDPFSDNCEISPLFAADTLSYCSQSVQKNAFRKFRRGNFPIADELDLHGLSRIQARELLLDFLKHTLIPSRHCVRIIHGKGHRSTGNQAILKTQVNHWLQQHKRVLAFHSCIPSDGGTGAVYVLLRLLA